MLYLITLLILSCCVFENESRDHHKLLLVSFDGLRWDYSDRAPMLEAFRYLRENGVKAKYMREAFPTQTSPCHFTIATGLHTESHGVVHNCYYDIEENKVTPNFYRTLAINEWWDNGGEPIWITAVKQGLTSGGYLFPGSYANISGYSATMKLLENAGTPAEESDWRHRIDETMEWFTTFDLDMIALYFEQPDKDGHQYGPDDDYINEITLPLLDRTIMYLINQVEKYQLTDDLNIIITSDHGFETIDTTVRGDDAISLWKYVNNSDVNFQFSYGPLGLVEPIPGQVENVAEQLRNGNPHMTVYVKDEIPERLHYKNSDRVPSIVVLADVGYAVYPIFPGFHINTGEHGYDNQVENMRATYYSIGPSFKKGFEMEGFDSVDIYPLMCHLLGLNPAPNNGSLDVLGSSLSSGARIQSGNFSFTVLSFAMLSTLMGIFRF